MLKEVSTFYELLSLNPVNDSLKCLKMNHLARKRGRRKADERDEIIKNLQQSLSDNEKIIKKQAEELKRKNNLISTFRKLSFTTNSNIIGASLPAYDRIENIRNQSILRTVLDSSECVQSKCETLKDEVKTLENELNNKECINLSKDLMIKQYCGIIEENKTILEDFKNVKYKKKVKICQQIEKKCLEAYRWAIRLGKVINKHDITLCESDATLLEKIQQQLKEKVPVLKMCAIEVDEDDSNSSDADEDQRHQPKILKDQETQTYELVENPLIGKDFRKFAAYTNDLGSSIQMELSILSSTVEDENSVATEQPNNDENSTESIQKEGKLPTTKEYDSNRSHGHLEGKTMVPVPKCLTGVPSYSAKLNHTSESNLKEPKSVDSFNEQSTNPFTGVPIDRTSESKLKEPKRYDGSSKGSPQCSKRKNSIISDDSSTLELSTASDEKSPSNHYDRIEIKNHEEHEQIISTYPIDHLQGVDKKENFMYSCFKSCHHPSTSKTEQGSETPVHCYNSSEPSPLNVLKNSNHSIFDQKTLNEVNCTDSIKVEQDNNILKDTERNNTIILSISGMIEPDFEMFLSKIRGEFHVPDCIDKLSDSDSITETLEMDSALESGVPELNSFKDICISNQSVEEFTQSKNDTIDNLPSDSIVSSNIIEVYPLSSQCCNMNNEVAVQNRISSTAVIDQHDNLKNEGLNSSKNSTLPENKPSNDVPDCIDKLSDLDSITETLEMDSALESGVPELNSFKDICVSNKSVEEFTQSKNDTIDNLPSDSIVSSNIIEVYPLSSQCSKMNNEVAVQNRISSTAVIDQHDNLKNEGLNSSKNSTLPENKPSNDVEAETPVISKMSTIGSYIIPEKLDTFQSSDGEAMCSNKFGPVQGFEHCEWNSVEKSIHSLPVSNDLSDSDECDFKGWPSNELYKEKHYEPCMKKQKTLKNRHRGKRTLNIHESVRRARVLGKKEKAQLVSICNDLNDYANSSKNSKEFSPHCLELLPLIDSMIIDNYDDIINVDHDYLGGVLEIYCQESSQNESEINLLNSAEIISQNKDRTDEKENLIPSNRSVHDEVVNFIVCRKEDQRNIPVIGIEECKSLRRSLRTSTDVPDLKSNSNKDPVPNIINESATAQKPIIEKVPSFNFCSEVSEADCKSDQCDKHKSESCDLPNFEHRKRKVEKEEDSNYSKSTQLDSSDDKYVDVSKCNNTEEVGMIKSKNGIKMAYKYHRKYFFQGCPLANGILEESNSERRSSIQMELLILSSTVEDKNSVATEQLNNDENSTESIQKEGKLPTTKKYDSNRSHGHLEGKTMVPVPKCLTGVPSYSAKLNHTSESNLKEPKSVDSFNEQCTNPLTGAPIDRTSESKLKEQKRYDGSSKGSRRCSKRKNSIISDNSSTLELSTTSDEKSPSIISDNSSTLELSTTSDEKSPSNHYDRIEIKNHEKHEQTISTYPNDHLQGVNKKENVIYSCFKSCHHPSTSKTEQGSETPVHCYNSSEPSCLNVLKNTNHSIFDQKTFNEVNCTDSIKVEQDNNILKDTERNNTIILSSSGMIEPDFEMFLAKIRGEFHVPDCIDKLSDSDSITETLEMDSALESGVPELNSFKDICVSNKSVEEFTQSKNDTIDNLPSDSIVSSNIIEVYPLSSQCCKMNNEVAVQNRISSTAVIDQHDNLKNEGSNSSKNSTLPENKPSNDVEAETPVISKMSTIGRDITPEKLDTVQSSDGEARCSNNFSPVQGFEHCKWNSIEKSIHSLPVSNDLSESDECDFKGWPLNELCKEKLDNDHYSEEEAKFSNQFGPVQGFEHCKWNSIKQSIHSLPVSYNLSDSDECDFKGWPSNELYKEKHYEPCMKKQKTLKNRHRGKRALNIHESVRSARVLEKKEKAQLVSICNDLNDYANSSKNSKEFSPHRLELLPLIDRMIIDNCDDSSNVDHDYLGGVLQIDCQESSQNESEINLLNSAEITSQNKDRTDKKEISIPSNRSVLDEVGNFIVFRKEDQRHIPVIGIEERKSLRRSLRTSTDVPDLKSNSKKDPVPNIMNESATAQKPIIEKVPSFNFYSEVSETDCKSDQCDKRKSESCDLPNFEHKKRNIEKEEDSNCSESTQLDSSDDKYVDVSKCNNTEEVRMIKSKNVIKMAYKYHRKHLYQGCALANGMLEESNSERKFEHHNQLAEELFIRVAKASVEEKESIGEEKEDGDNGECEYWTSELLGTCLQQLQCIPSRVISEVIIDTLYNDVGDLDLDAAAPLSDLQKKVVTIAYKLCSDVSRNPSFFSSLLISFRKFLLLNAESEKVIRYCKYVRFLTVLCRTLGKIEEMRWLVYDLLYFRKMSGIPMVYTALCMWPSLLPIASPIEKACPLALCISHVLLNNHINDPRKKLVYKTTKIEYLVKRFYGYAECSPPEVFNQLMKEINTDGALEAIALLCKRIGPKWTLTFVVEESLLPILKEWKMKKTNSAAVVNAIRILGCVLRPFLQGNNNAKLNDVLRNIGTFLTDPEADDKIQAVAAESLCRLSKGNMQLCIELLVNWRPRNGMVPEQLIKHMRAFIARRKPVSWLKLMAQNNLIEN